MLLLVIPVLAGCVKIQASITISPDDLVSGEITAAAKQSFLDGDQWAYTAGLVAVALGAVLVFFMFPRKDEEQRALA